MPTPSDAFDEASGRAAEGSAADADVRRAQRILALRRRALADEGCPPAARARAAGLFAAARPASWLERARCLFDSWLEPQAATRGSVASHLLRFAQGELAADIEIEAQDDGTFVVRLALENAPATAELFLLTGEDTPPLAIELDDDGSAVATLPATTSAFELEVFDGPHALLFTDAIPLERAT